MINAAYSRPTREKPLRTIARKISRAERRGQIVLATMRVLARKGYSQTMISDVAGEAGVSHGLVLFHFKSKEKLLTATLLHMAEEYRLNWINALDAARPHPAQQLAAMLAADYRKEICTQVHLACWCAFWGEVQSRPIYQQECASNDLSYIRKLEEICADLIREGNYAHDAVRVARVLRFVSEGLWNDMLSMKKPYRQSEALTTLFACAATYFPGHFTGAGALSA